MKLNFFRLLIIKIMIKKLDLVTIIKVKKEKEKECKEHKQPNVVEKKKFWKSKYNIIMAL